MNKIVKVIAIVLWCLLALIGGFGLWMSDRYVVPIMMYHSIGTQPEKIAHTTDPQHFVRHLEFLNEHKYHVISFAELVEAIKSATPLPRKTVVITFDDGYVDNYTQAFPELKKYGFPATIFVIVDQIGKEGYLTLEQIKEMESQGITIGAHSRTHGYLPDLTESEQIEEIAGGKKALEKKLDHPVDFMAYPSGGFSEEIKNITKQAGFKAACTTNRGYDRLNGDLYELKRIRFGDGDNSPVILFVKLSGFYSTFKKVRSPY